MNAAGAFGSPNNEAIGGIMKKWILAPLALVLLNGRSLLALCVLSLMVIGSANAQWVQTNDPSGGAMQCFAVSPASGGDGSGLASGL